MRPPCAGPATPGAALIVTSRLVAADLVSDGVDADRITIVHGGSDHLVPEDPAQSDALLRRLGVPGSSSSP